MNEPKPYTDAEMSHLKKIYMLKRDREEAMFSSPKTPSKKIAYKHMLVSPIPLAQVSIQSVPHAIDGKESSTIGEDSVFSDGFLQADMDTDVECRKDGACNFICKTGEGAFYEVFVNKKGESRNDGDEDELVMVSKNRKLCIYDIDYTVVKKSKKRVSGGLDRKNRMKEVEMLRKIRSEYVVKYHDAWESGGHLFIELEYCSIGTLRDYIHEVYFLKKSRFSGEIVKKMMYELANGLNTIHECGIVHLDLKPENVLVKSVLPGDACEGRCICEFPVDPSVFVFKISDFNISRYEGEDIDDDGDKRYMAPEVLQDVCTKASDVYSLGMIYLEVLAEIILPRSGDSWMRLRRNDFRGIKIDRVCKMMLDMNYKKRLSALEVADMFL